MQQTLRQLIASLTTAELRQCYEEILILNNIGVLPANGLLRELRGLLGKTSEDYSDEWGACFPNAFCEEMADRWYEQI